jgi:hypothetical protein
MRNQSVSSSGVVVKRSGDAGHSCGPALLSYTAVRWPMNSLPGAASVLRRWMYLLAPSGYTEGREERGRDQFI